MNKFDIIFEDNHILVVVKPENIPVQEDESGDKDFLSMLKQDIKERYNKPGNVYLALLHRLDRPVGGIMLFAKTSKAAARLSEQFRKNSVHKRYKTVVHGKPQRGEIELEDYLYKNREHNIVSIVSRDTVGAKIAKLTFHKEKTNHSLSLLTVTLVTGRSHQIRVQLAQREYPIVGDQKYGNRKERGQQIALWSYSLSFEHPTTHEQLSFTANPPNFEPWIFF
ncbi:RluA family pseudouridine synthase [bacterium]|nr:RluA family pseudouridine synthase [bacterium]